MKILNKNIEDNSKCKGSEFVGRKNRPYKMEIPEKSSYCKKGGIHHKNCKKQDCACECHGVKIQEQLDRELR